ncbi:MAG: energy-coupling factor ABC transporter ATP-binding protein [Deltaproteobacteria bacterium]|jgi:biotin transport system ATP-binding protein|nr:energy-coupling factor ABC transporter ATP-binding protein [Deltaproteobacteria bacterium]
MIIKARSLCFSYNRSEKEILRNLDFNIRAGELVAVVGVNGSGKSTLLTVLAGLLPPTSGELSVLGGELPQERSKLDGLVGLVPQNPDVFILGAVVQEDLLLGVDPADEEARERTLTMARELGLADLLDNPIQTLSFGQKRKLCLASTLASNPKLILLDEPMAGLDFPASLSVRHILSKNKKSGLTQIVASHDLDLTADLTDSYIILQDGQIIVQGGAEEVFPRLIKAGVRPPCWWYTGDGPAWLEG